MRYCCFRTRERQKLRVLGIIVNVRYNNFEIMTIFLKRILIFQTLCRVIDTVLVNV